MANCLVGEQLYSKVRDVIVVTNIAIVENQLIIEYNHVLQYKKHY